MCGPLMGLMGSMVSAIGGMASSNAKAASLNAQAQFEDRQASMEYTKGSYQIALQKRQEDRIQGGQTVGFAHGGIDTESGTPKELSSATDIEMGLDRQAIRFGRDLNSSNYEYKANIDRMNAGQAQQAGMFSAFSNMFSGYTKLGGNFQMA